MCPHIQTDEISNVGDMIKEKWNIIHCSDSFIVFSLSYFWFLVGTRGLALYWILDIINHKNAKDCNKITDYF